MRALFGVAESAPRIAEYDAAIKYWMKKHNMIGDPPPDAKVYAFLKAQDQTINYSRHGIAGKWINQMVPFWNANMQDLSKVYRTFKTRGAEATLYAITYLTLPALALWWLNRDKTWYKSLPAYEKANYLHVDIGKGRILRLPVPFLVGHIFQGMPVAIMDSLYTTDPKKVTDMLGQMYQQDIFPLTGRFFFDQFGAIGPVIDVLQNKDWAGRPIVSKRLEGKLPSDQYKEYTTKFAKVFAGIFNKAVPIKYQIAPLQIEYLLNSWSGGLYRRGVKGVELATGLSGIDQPVDMPVIGTLFVRDPYAPKMQIQTYYERREELDRMYQSRKISAAERRERTRMHKISKTLTALWRRLEKEKTIAGRKKIYERMSSLITRYSKRKD
jgi:hypothetical protein